MRDCRLDDAGPGFGMQALERKPHRTAQLEQTLIEIGMDRRAQQRIAEISRRDGPQVAIMLVAHRMRRLLEQEELVFGGCARRIAHALGAPQHALERAARAHRLGGADEFRKEQQHVAFERHRAAGRRHDRASRVRIGGVPAGEADVVVELVARIPAEHHVAEAKAVLERREEFLAGEIFAAQHAVDVEHAELDVREPALAHDLPGIRRALDLARVHGPPSVVPEPERSEGIRDP